MGDTTALQPQNKILAIEANHMGYLLDIREFKCSSGDAGWFLNPTLYNYLSAYPIKCWENTWIYYMETRLIYNQRYQLPYAVVMYKNQITGEMVYHCEICNPDLQFRCRRDQQPKQTACTHSKWIGLYVDDV